MRNNNKSVYHLPRGVLRGVRLGVMSGDDSTAVTPEGEIFLEDAEEPEERNHNK